MSETKSIAKAHLFVINTKLSTEIEEMSDPETIKLINQSVHDQGLISKLRHGDLVALSEERYRNEGVWIWDSENSSVESLDYEIDDYGSVPDSYRVTADGPFTPDYWLDCVDHNCIVHLDSDLLTGIKPGDTVTIQGKTWKVVLDADGEEDTEGEEDTDGEDLASDLTGSEWYFECIEGQLVAKKKNW